MTRVLGPRHEVDLARERQREIHAIDVTSLDRELLAQTRRGAQAQLHRPDLIARLEQLERLSLKHQLNKPSYAVERNLLLILAFVHRRFSVRCLF